MRSKYNLLTALCVIASIPLVWHLLNREMAASSIPVVRIASFNAALNRPEPGQLLEELRGGGCEQARQIAEIVQRNGIDVLLLCELDRDDAAASAAVFADEYLAVSQNGAAPIRFDFRFVGEVNTGEPSGVDLDGDGELGGPGDAYGYGAFPGQYGMALFSRHPILVDEIRTFRELPWMSMPDAVRPDGFYTEAAWAKMRLSSKSHWDVPVGVAGKRIHVLCSHPTPPVFDGPEDRNGCRNHDEIRFWVDYLTPEKSGWIVDDNGVAGGLAEDADFVLLGDLNCDPVDGEGLQDALRALLAHPRIQDPEPRSDGGAEESTREWGANASQKGDPALDTGDFEDVPGKGPGNLRVDYVLVSRSLGVDGEGVFWPLDYMDTRKLEDASDHRLVWVDVLVPPEG